MSDFWTMERIDTLRQMHAGGHTCREIGMAIGTSRNAVIGKLHRLGLAKQSIVDQWTPERLATLKRMHVDGASYEDIATATGFCVASCRAKASRIGLGKRGNVHYSYKSKRTPPGFKPKIVEGIAPPSTDRAVPIYDVTGCKWAITPDNCDKGSHLFCNHDTAGDGPYCAYHTELGRSKPIPKGEVVRFKYPVSYLRAVA